MDLEAYLRSNCPTLSTLDEGPACSSISEAMLCNGYLPQNEFAAYLGSSSGGSPLSDTDMNSQFNNYIVDPAFSNYRTSSGASVKESSLITDANSTFSGTSIFLGNAGKNQEIYLTSSPMSFSSDNLLNLSNNCTQPAQCLITDARMNDFFSTHIRKKLRMELRLEDIPTQYMIREILKDMRMQKLASQLSMAQQQASQNQQEARTFPSIPPSHMSQSRQQAIGSQDNGVGFCQESTVPGVFGGPCALQLMRYLYHTRSRPIDNNIAYWRSFIAAYYDPDAKKKWCLSKYPNIKNHALGTFSQCGICGSHPRTGFDATFEVLPRLYKINLDEGVTDQLLYLDFPLERELPSGLTVLECKRAVMESVYLKFHVVHEGQLRIIFSQHLKILSWEFCGQRHEEFVSKKLVASQVQQLLDAAGKYQTTSERNKKGTATEQDLVSDCKRFVRAGTQLAKNLELDPVSNLGFSKQVVRCLQVAEVATSMKDLMSCTLCHNIGPIEAYNLQSQMKRKGLEPGSQGLYTEEIKFTPLAMSSSAQDSYQELLMRDSMASNPSIQKTKPNPSCLFHSASYNRDSSLVYNDAQLSFSSTSFDQGSLNQQLLSQTKLSQLLCEDSASKGAPIRSTKVEHEVSSEVGGTKRGGSKQKARGSVGAGKGQRSTRAGGTGYRSAGSSQTSHDTKPMKGEHPKRHEVTGDPRSVGQEWS